MVYSQVDADLWFARQPKAYPKVFIFQLYQIIHTNRRPDMDSDIDNKMYLNVIRLFNFFLIKIN